MKFIIIGTFIAVVLIVNIFYVRALMQPCDGGHILKNVFDWPVCVK